MPTFAELIEEQRGAAGAGSTKIQPATQAARDQTASELLQAEFRRLKERGQSTVDLEREMAFRKVPVPSITAPSAPAPSAAATPAAAAPTTGTFADFMESMKTGGPQAQAEVETPKAEAPSPVYSFFRDVLKTPIEAGKQLYGTLEAARSAIAGGVAVPLSAVGGLITGVTEGKGPTSPEVQRVVGGLQERIMAPFAPRTEAGRTQAEALQQAFEASKVPPVGVPGMEAPTAAGAQAAAQMARRGEAAVRAPISQMREWHAEISGKPVPGAAPGAAPTTVAPPGSVGAMKTPELATVQAALEGATPELRKVVEAIPAEQRQVPVILKHIEADSLPVPVRMTKGQASGDVVQLSNEANRRGRDPQFAQFFNEQNRALVENMSALRERAAPDVYTTRPIESSEAIMQAYRDLDTARQGEIRSAYDALKNAAGGEFPVNGQAIASRASELLSKDLKTEFVPPAIRRQLRSLEKGEPLTYEQFEALRTNLAAEMRRAAKAGDGNAERAASLVRQAVEELPLTGEAAALKPLADRARSLAKQRFDEMRADPAYSAVVNEKATPDNFMQKYVIGGRNKDVRKMLDTFGPDSLAAQNMRAGLMQHLSDRAGIGMVEGQANFSQAQFNRALKQLDDQGKLQMVFDPAMQTQLRTLGNVASYVQFQPRGSFVNNSNTLVAALAARAQGLAGAAVERGLNVAVPGLQAGSALMEARAARQQRREVKKALELGAGSKKE